MWVAVVSSRSIFGVCNWRVSAGLTIDLAAAVDRRRRGPRDEFRLRRPARARHDARAELALPVQQLRDPLQEGRPRGGQQGRGVIAHDPQMLVGEGEGLRRSGR